jgi:hypothetical protein
MISAQKINGEHETTIFGIVSNGRIWQFGKLAAQTFTKNILYYSIQELDKLFSVINFVFQECELHLKRSLILF